MGADEGCGEGGRVGSAVGAKLGQGVGTPVGLSVGSADGAGVGTSVGDAVGLPNTWSITTSPALKLGPTIAATVVWKAACALLLSKKSPGDRLERRCLTVKVTRICTAAEGICVGTELGWPLGWREGWRVGWPVGRVGWKVG